MIILGIDPGSRMTGWGLVNHSKSRSSYLASGTIRLGSSAPLPQRLVKLCESIEELLERHHPEECAIEQIFTAKNARSALVLGHARGVIVCAVARKGVALQEYSATQVKQAVVGQGRAEKSQVQLMVAALLGRKEPLQEDEADALAVALTHAAFSNLARKIS